MIKTWSPVRTLPVAPLWCDRGFVPNSLGDKAAANLRPKYSKIAASRQMNKQAKSAAYNQAYNDVKHEFDAGSKINAAVQAKIARDRYIKIDEKMKQYKKI